MVLLRALLRGEKKAAAADGDGAEDWPEPLRPTAARSALNTAARADLLEPPLELPLEPKPPLHEAPVILPSGDP